MKNIVCVILAAGKGVRMQSDLPKVFHKIGNKPMLSYVLKTAKKIKPQKIYVVVGYKRKILLDYYQNKKLPIAFVSQEKQLGTGHAVLQVEPYLKKFSGTVLILNGDVPLLSAKTLRKLIAFHQEEGAAATILTTILKDPSHYGRIMRRRNGKIERIVESKDATPKELKIQEINTGTFCFEKELLFWALSKVERNNQQKEYYLTDTIEILKNKGYPIYPFVHKNPQEVLGVNTPQELQTIENILLFPR